METETAKPLGEYLPALVAGQTAEPDSRRLPTAEVTALDLNTLPARLDDQTLAMVEAMANTPLPALASCPDNKFTQAMRYLAASLPSRATDDLAGELRFEAYRRTLGHLPAEAIGFLTGEALRTCRWFPTIAECLEMAAGWSRGDTGERSRAAGIVEKERRERWNDLRRAVRSGEMPKDAIEALPDRVKRALDNDNLIRVDGQGRVFWVQPSERGAA